MAGRFNGLLGMLGLKEKKPDVVKNRNTAPKYEERELSKKGKKPEEERELPKKGKKPEEEWELPKKARKPEEERESKKGKISEEERSADRDEVQQRPQRGGKLQPLDVIDGFQVRPGFYNRDGATATSNGVSFTIHSIGATGCTLLLFRPQEMEPYARLKFPKPYHIGNTYSMLVFGLKIEEFEYAFQLDGPYDREKGLLFKPENVLLDPYAKAVTGQRNWGERDRKSTL